MLEQFSIRLGVSRVCEISVAFFFGNTFEKRGKRAFVRTQISLRARSRGCGLATNLSHLGDPAVPARSWRAGGGSLLSASIRERQAAVLIWSGAF
jgi:hypothetical protein